METRARDDAGEKVWRPSRSASSAAPAPDQRFGFGPTSTPSATAYGDDRVLGAVSHPLDCALHGPDDAPVRQTERDVELGLGVGVVALPLAADVAADHSPT